MTFPQSGARGNDRVRALPSLSQTIDVETPELVVFSYTIAGVGSRALAAVIDSLICIAAVVAIVVTFVALSPSRPERIGPGPGSVFDAWATAIVVLGVFCVLWGYYVLFEGLADGQTPGKRLLRLRVVLDGGYSVTFGASAVHNLVRVVDIQPIPCYVVGILSVIFSKSGKRLGDIVAGTVVVREALIRQLAPSEPSSTPDAIAALDTALTEEEFTVLEHFMERQSSLDGSRRSALAEQLATRLASALPSNVARTTSAADLAVLGRLLQCRTRRESERRRGTRAAWRRARAQRAARHPLTAMERVRGASRRRAATWPSLAWRGRRPRVCRRVPRPRIGSRAVADGRTGPGHAGAFLPQPLARRRAQPAVSWPRGDAHPTSSASPPSRPRAKFAGPGAR